MRDGFIFIFGGLEIMDFLLEDSDPFQGSFRVLILVELPLVELLEQLRIFACHLAPICVSYLYFIIIINLFSTNLTVQQLINIEQIDWSIVCTIF